jgi:hypothetical protein
MKRSSELTFVLVMWLCWWWRELLRLWIRESFYVREGRILGYGRNKDFRLNWRCKEGIQVNQAPRNTIETPQDYKQSGGGWRNATVTVTQRRWRFTTNRHCLPAPICFISCSECTSFTGITCKKVVIGPMFQTHNCQT